MNITLENKFNWDLDDQKWSNLDFVMNKFNHYNQIEIINCLPFISESLWQNVVFTDFLIKNDLIAEAFKVFPVLSSWDKQAVLEDKLLHNITNEETLIEVWDNYLHISYVYMKHSNEYHNLLKANQDSKYICSIVNNIRAQKKVSPKFLKMLFENNYTQTKEMYKKVISFVEQEIFTGIVYKNFIKPINNEVKYNDNNNGLESHGEANKEYLPVFLKLKKILIGNEKFDYKKYSFLKGSIYPYLPHELQHDNDYIRFYLHHIGQCNTKARDSQLLQKTNIEENRKYNNVDINAMPLCYFQTIKDVADYYINVAVGTKFTDRKQNISDLDIFSKSEVLSKYKGQKNFWLDLLVKIIEINSHKALGLWNFFIPEEKKNDPQFIISILSHYQVLEEKIKNNTNSVENEHDKKILIEIENFSRTIYKILPLALQTNTDISKKYLAITGNIEEVKLFSLDLLDLNHDRALIKQILSKKSLFNYIYDLEESNNTNSVQQESIRIKNRETIEIWKQDIDLMTNCNVNNVKFLQVPDHVWEEWLSLPKSLDKILSINKDMFSILPEKFYTKEIVLYCMNQSISLPKNMTNKYWEDSDYCLKACYINCNYIEKIPHEHWKDISFIKEIFALIDDIDPTIIEEIMHETPIFVQQFLHDHEIHENYSSFINSYILKHNIEKKLDDTASINNIGNLDKVDHTNNTTKSVKKLKI